MHSNQWITLFGILCITFAAVQFVSAGGSGGDGGGHGNHGNGHGHGQGGKRNQTQCNQVQQFFNQWWPQSALIATFQTVCRQVGVTQAWSLLQSLLGIPVTGALDQTTFQALLNNNNHVLLAQQLLTLAGSASTTTYPSVGK